MGLFDLGSGLSGGGGSANPNVYNSFFGGANLNTALQAPRPVINQSVPNQLNYVSSLSSGNQTTQPQPQPGPAPAPNNGGGGGGFVPGSDAPAGLESWGANWQAHLADIQRQENELRNNISSGWDNYLGSLSGLEGNLGNQRTAQENIANSQYETGMNTINAQKSKSMRDVANNIKNAFQAGNIYLGSRGAGDSSAANQYAFAINQEGAKQTGNINEYVSNQLQQLGAAKDEQINRIAAWFAEQQNAIRQQIASGQLNKSRDIQALSQNILNQALQEKARIEQNATAQYNGLLSWAASNSQNVNQLRQNIAGIPQAMGMPQIDSGGNFRAAPTGLGFGNSDERDRLF